MLRKFEDQRRELLKKFSWLEIPYLPIVVSGIPVLALLLESLGYPSHLYIFLPDRILQGELWRFLAFPLSSMGVFWLVFYVIYTYFVVNAIEAVWGNSQISVYICFAYLMAALSGFIFMRYVPIWYYVMLNVTLAFGVLFPDKEFLFYFVLRVKAKWLSLFAGFFFLFSFVLTSMQAKFMMFLSVVPFLLFFGPQFVNQLIVSAQQKKRRRDFQDKMKD